MFKTLFKALLYLVFLSFLLVLIVTVFHDLILYYLNESSDVPRIIIIAEKIVSVPVIGELIYNIVGALR